MSVIKPDFETACDMVRDFARKYVGTQPYARLDEQNRQLHIGLRELNQYATGTGFDKPLRFDLPNGFGWLAIGVEAPCLLHWFEILTSNVTGSLVAPSL